MALCIYSIVLEGQLFPPELYLILTVVEVSGIVDVVSTVEVVVVSDIVEVVIVVSAAVVVVEDVVSAVVVVVVEDVVSAVVVVEVVSHMVEVVMHPQTSVIRDGKTINTMQKSVKNNPLIFLVISLLVIIPRDIKINYCSHIP